MSTILIKQILTDKKQFLHLLLLGDEQETMIDRYLMRGDLFALYDDDSLRTVCVVTKENSTSCELKNIATYEIHQGCGYGKKIVNHIVEHYRATFKTLFVGTADSEKTLQFYASCGFIFSHRCKNFFLNQYDHPIYEDGKQLIDMIYLRKELS